MDTANPIRNGPQLGQFLIDQGKLDLAGLRRAERMVEVGTEPLPSVLSKLGLVSERDIALSLTDMLDLPLADASDYPTVPAHKEGLSVNFLTASRAVPVEDGTRSLTVAMANPLDTDAIDALRLFAGKTIEIKVGIPADIEAAIERLYGEQPSSTDLIESGDGREQAAVLDDIEHLRDLASEAPVVRIVNRMIADAVEQQASDIHVEPFEHKLRVRFRIDGVLRDAETLSPALHPAVVSRLKIMAGLNIAERRLPQDGRFKLAVRGRDIDLRLATMPIMHGEAIVLRILDRDNVELDFERLGFQATSLQTLREALARPSGIVLVTGPTGSGKTTTLYTSLVELNTDNRKVLTVEDPIEYQLEGINQVQIKPQIDLSFASVLRAMLRHDPDIIMVGEIRDLETADIAIRAALTGHLVLSTLHTNNAAGTLARLLDMGLEAFLLASTLNAIVAQRLVRQLCPSCCKRYEPIEEMRQELGAILDDIQFLWRAAGCDRCSGTGYAGRIGVNEILMPSDKVRQGLLRRVDATSLHRLAVESGMRPMLLDGIDKAKNGVTTIEEVLRVTREAA